MCMPRKPLYAPLEWNAVALLNSYRVIKRGLKYKGWDGCWAGKPECPGEAERSLVTEERIRKSRREGRFRCLVRLIPQLSHTCPSLVGDLDPHSPVACFGLAMHEHRHSSAEEIASLGIIRSSDGALVLTSEGAELMVIWWDFEKGIRVPVRRLHGCEVMLLPTDTTERSKHSRSSSG